MNASSVRVRIAPSPTGNLHVGTARTALFNYLFARRCGGTFILRIEDTDRQRSERRFVDNIYEGLRALGLHWDEGPDVGGAFGPYIQSERLHVYQPLAEQLVQLGHAYYDFTSEEELETLRQKAAEAQQPFVYRGEALDEEEQARRLEAKEPYSIRFRIPRTLNTLVVQDAIRGEVTFDAALQGDFVILKSDGTPSYNFAVVVDDHQMGITHVLRGEDHLPNTPRQQLLYSAFGWPLPVFGHLGMILSPDRSKLSKRHGATAVADYVHQGYLPEAFVNFLALLGWSSPDGEELLTLAQLVERFALERVSHSGAIFDKDKLNWMNGHYIRQLPLPDLLQRCLPYWQEAGYDMARYHNGQLETLLLVTRDTFTTLSDVVEATRLFFQPTVTVEPKIVQDVLATPEAVQVMNFALNTWLNEADFTSGETLQLALKQLTQSLKPLKPKTILWTIRAAVTGQVQGPDLSQTLWLLGRVTVEERFRAAKALVPAGTLT